MLLLIPLLPFLGFLLNASFGKRVSKAAAGAVACGAMVGSFLVALVSVWRLIALPAESRAIANQLFTWISSGDFTAAFTLRLDPLSSVMILVITGIGSLIHIYSTAYMHEETDAEYARYFSYLNLFAAFMLVLVLGSNFLVMFVGWEGVGLCSYLLIGFWYQKKSASDAGKKAFIVNRIGDFGFVLGVLLLFVRFGTVDFQEVARAAAGAEPGDHLRDDDVDHAAAVCRRHRQVGADSALHLAAGRHGRADAGVRADSRGDDGDRGCVHDRPQRRAVQPRAGNAGDRRGRSARPPR